MAGTDEAAIAARGRRPKARRRCVFCGAADLTLEHALPSWIPKRLGLTGPVTVRQGGAPVAQRQVLEVKIRAVCGSCNKGWMADLEGRVSQLIGNSMRDGPTRFGLGPADQKVVATWAVKTALMLELATAYLRGPSLAPKSHFQWLVERHQPPPGSRVWIFGVEAQGRVAMWAKAGTLEPVDAKTPYAYLATFTTGYIGFQVFGPDILVPKETVVVAETPALEPPADLRTVLRRLWPSTVESFGWPPSHVVNLDGLDVIAGWPSLFMEADRRSTSSESDPGGLSGRFLPQGAQADRP